ncbi:MAG: cob(I)yrinic acid a,c-diamide adenosyltransferase [Bacteroidales bacterium]|nr:cob(I)yrinic acid a,c-diamide adenosyltransferase [Bacteroidales bacterium]
MKIYTKAGDRGMTSLLGGNLVPKDHPRLEAYGTLDELNSWIGLLRDHLKDKHLREELLRIQDRLMVGSSILANEKTEGSIQLPELKESDIKSLEESIDAMDAELQALTSFILPGGHPVVSYCHLARTCCRRAERYSTGFIKDSDQTGLLVKYLNRLSDYIFTLSRKIAKDFNIEEILWQPES